MNHSTALRKPPFEAEVRTNAVRVGHPGEPLRSRASAASALAVLTLVVWVLLSSSLVVAHQEPATPVQLPGTPSPGPPPQPTVAP